MVVLINDMLVMSMLLYNYSCNKSKWLYFQIAFYVFNIVQKQIGSFVYRISF